MRADLCRVMIQAMYFAIKYDDSNPDVGMPMGEGYFLDMVCRRSEVELSTAERAYVLNTYSQEYRR